MPVNIVSDGIVTRSVRDTAAFAASAEQAHRHPKFSAIGLVQGAGKEKLRVGVLTKRADSSQSDPECVAAVERVAKTIESLGHRVETLEVVGEDHIADDFKLYWSVMAGALRYGGKYVSPNGLDAAKLESWTRLLASTAL